MASPTYIAATASQDIASKDSAHVARWVAKQVAMGNRIAAAYVRTGPERPGCSEAAPSYVTRGGVSRMADWFRQTAYNLECSR